MHNHGTAVLDRPAEATSAAIPGASSRDRWLAKCESQLAAALALGNAVLLPDLPGFLPESERCPDCRATGYDHETLDLCFCMAGERPAYDFLRYASGEVPFSMVAMSRHHPDKADVWQPCQCGITPIMHGPYNRDGLIRVPWVPDCTVCDDTGWAFVHHIPARDFPCW